MKMPSLKGQLINAINSNFCPGGDHHSAKHQDTAFEKIFSYTTRNNLVDVACQLAEYLKTNTDIKQVKDISTQAVQDFLNSKAGQCNQETLHNYTSRLAKLGELINQTYKTANVDFRVVEPASLKDAAKLRDIAMTREDYQKIIDYAKSQNLTSQAIPAVRLAGEFGLRVHECCKLTPKDIDFQRMELHVVGKGGRERILPIHPEQVSFLKSLIDGKGETEKIITIKDDSVNRWLQRVEEKLGMTQYKECKTGIHSIRKMVAQELYDKYRAAGLSIKEAWGNVAEYLGHGRDRTELMKVYITNIK